MSQEGAVNRPESSLWADLEAESRKPGPTMTITKAQYGALRERLAVLEQALRDIVELDSGDRWDGWREVRRIHDIAEDALSRSDAQPAEDGSDDPEWGHLVDSDIRP